MTDDAFGKALEQQDAAIASMLNGDPGPIIDSWAASDDVTLFGAWGPVEKGHKPVTDRRMNGDWKLMHRHADFPPRDQRNDAAR